MDNRPRTANPRGKYEPLTATINFDRDYTPLGTIGNDKEDGFKQFQFKDVKLGKPAGN
jgi:hypothetical protein